MKLDTLIYIKELMEAEVSKKEKGWKKAGAILREHEDDEGVSWNTSDNLVSDDIKMYRELKNTAKEEYSRVSDFYDDFMSKEWS